MLWLLSATSCWDDVEPLSSDCPSDLLSGDLVVTELMPDPEGNEADSFEWIEVYNATSRSIDLEGLLLERSRVDGSGVQGGPLPAYELNPWDYAVLGQGRSPFDHVDVPYGQLIGDLSNGSGRVAIGCAGQLLDEVTYTEPTEGTSQAFDGALAPDASLNDRLEMWCPSRSEYPLEADLVERGTPGRPNDLCPGSGPTTCEEDGVARDVLRPERGDVVITEFLANPVGPDAGREWIELEVRRTVDLNGLWLGPAVEKHADVVLPRTCLRVEAGTHLVFASDTDPEMNGGLPSVVHGLGWVLGNVGPRSIVVGWGDDVLDEVTYLKTIEGRSSSLDPGASTPELNDEPASFCPGTDPWSEQSEDRGTPGAPNPPCPFPVGPGRCRTAEGSVRAIRHPQPGDLLVTEIMANPHAVPDAQGEWIELAVAASVDLNGVVLSKGTSTFELDEMSCLSVQADTFVVLGRDTDPVRNGGLPPLAATFDLALENYNGELALHAADRLVDAVRWEVAPPGRALVRATHMPAHESETDAWCEALDTYGAGDRGTPGIGDPLCDPWIRWCMDDDGPRHERAPQLGDVVVTEVLSDPAAAADADGEWVEFLALAPFDLSSLAARRNETDDPIPVGVEESDELRRCTPVEAERYVVLGRSGDLGENGGVEIDGVLGVALPNGGGSLTLLGGGTALDTVPLISFGPGISSSLDPAVRDPLGNDDPTVFCPSSEIFGDGDAGTPGQENPPCDG